MKLLYYPHYNLLNPTKPILKPDITLYKALRELIDVHKGVGLAANQIGSRSSTFALRRDAGNILIVNNPKIIEVGDPIEVEEACLSLPGIRTKIISCKEITLKYENEQLEPVCEIFSGLEAQCVWHEIKHLLGMMFLDSLPKVKRDRIMSKYRVRI